MLENQRFVEKKMRIDEEANVGESFMYRKRVVAVQRR